MAKDKVTVSIDAWVLRDADADAERAGLNRSAWVEKALQDAHYRQLLAAASSPALTEKDESQIDGLLDWQRDLGQSA